MAWGHTGAGVVQAGDIESVGWRGYLQVRLMGHHPLLAAIVTGLIWGLVFGYFGYLVARGWYERRLGSILLAIAVIILYGGLIVGVVPARALRPGRRTYSG